jgi:hypothetical protein
MVFAVEKKTYNEARTRTGSNYVKLVPEYRTVLRILDTNAALVWKHFIQEANAGKGMGAVCPNVTAQTRVCPIEKSLEGLDKDSQEVKDKRAKKRYIVNVLDRTPYTTCEACGTETPGKNCTSCGADLKKHTFKPLNKIKLLEGGPMLFLQGLNALEQLGQDDFNTDITGYDIVFQTQGKGRDKRTNVTPQQPSEIPDEDFLDPETGERQTKFNLDDLTEPNSIEEIELMMNGATMQDLNALRGIA